MSIDPIAGCMYTITIDKGSVSVGNTGYCETEWNGEKRLEKGQFISLNFRGREWHCCSENIDRSIGKI